MYIYIQSYQIVIPPSLHTTHDILLTTYHPRHTTHDIPLTTYHPQHITFTIYLLYDISFHHNIPPSEYSIPHKMPEYSTNMSRAVVRTSVNIKYPGNSIKLYSNLTAKDFVKRATHGSRHIVHRRIRGIFISRRPNGKTLVVRAQTFFLRMSRSTY